MNPLPIMLTIGAALLMVANRASAIVSAPSEGVSLGPDYGANDTPGGEFDYVPNFEPQDTIVEIDSGNYTMTYDHSNHPLLKLIQKRESGGDYFVVYGGRRFSDMRTHPYAGWKVGSSIDGVRGELTVAGIRPAVITTGKNRGDVSTAAGKYQMVIPTWIQEARATGVNDFSPNSQDLYAYSLLGRIGALRAYANGDLEGAIRKAATQWTSLPSATTGETTVSMTTALEELRGFV